MEQEAEEQVLETEIEQEEQMTEREYKNLLLK
jgi:hypothetical protein